MASASPVIIDSSTSKEEDLSTIKSVTIESPDDKKITSSITISSLEITSFLPLLITVTSSFLLILILSSILLALIS